MLTARLQRDYNNNNKNNNKLTAVSIKFAHKHYTNIYVYRLIYIQ